MVNAEFFCLNQADHRAGKVKRVRRASHQVVGDRQLLMILRCRQNAADFPLRRGGEQAARANDEGPRHQRAHSFFRLHLRQSVNVCGARLVSRSVDNVRRSAKHLRRGHQHQLRPDRQRRANHVQRAHRVHVDALCGFRFRFEQVSIRRQVDDGVRLLRRHPFAHCRAVRHIEIRHIHATRIHMLLAQCTHHVAPQHSFRARHQYLHHVHPFAISVHLFARYSS